MNNRYSDFYRRWGKRLLDVFLACTLLILLVPLVAVVAVAIRALTGSPVFYWQNRPGLDGRLFTLVKFRTMTDARAPDGSPLADAERLTRLGRLLRGLSLDEIPELLNVIRGEMSLVGPRPLLETYLSRYTARQARRHLVRPGVTGWAQVNGRNTTSWQQRLLLDEWYVDNVSLALDVRIMFLTVATILQREGISADGHVTMQEFLGAPDPPGADGGAHRVGVPAPRETRKGETRCWKR